MAYWPVRLLRSTSESISSFLVLGYGKTFGRLPHLQPGSACRFGGKLPGSFDSQPLTFSPSAPSSQVQFFLRGPNGTGMVTSEMFKDQETRDWQFTYLIVDITSPVPSRLMLESYLGGPAGAGS